MLLGHVVTLYLYLERGVSRDWGIPRHFDLNAEGNFASFFEATPLLIAALVTLALAAHYRAQRAPLAGRWAWLSGLLLFMSIDELAQLHDLFTGPLRRRLDLDFGRLLLHLAAPGGGLPRLLRVVLRAAGPLASGRDPGPPAGGRGHLLRRRRRRRDGERLRRRGRPAVHAVPHGARRSRRPARSAARCSASACCCTLLRSVQPRTTIELFDGGTIGIAPASPESPSATAPGPKAEQLP